MAGFDFEFEYDGDSGARVRVKADAEELLARWREGERATPR